MDAFVPTRIIATVVACVAMAAPAPGRAEPGVNGAKAQSALGSYARMHTFPGKNSDQGQAPYGTLVQGADGAFYGTNFFGGAAEVRCECTIGGTVYRLTLAGDLTLLHAFVGRDGFAPASGLVFGSDGALYGQTTGGGKYGDGTAFKVSVDGQFELLHSLGGTANDGAFPYLGSLVKGTDGNFYGTTMKGGKSAVGVAFRMTPSGTVKVLHAFSGGTDGANPRGQLMQASDGKLYGTAVCGGAAAGSDDCSGIVYSLTLAGNFKIVQRFSAAGAPESGFEPQSTLAEANGFLYGTTTAGGRFGYGTVFKISLGGSGLTIVHDFAGASTGDGAKPVGRLLLASDGYLYGTTSTGGSNHRVQPSGDGTIFRLSPSDGYDMVHAFGADAADGAIPLAGMMSASDGTLYGTTSTDADEYGGTIFSYKPVLPAIVR